MCTTPGLLHAFLGTRLILLIKCSYWETSLRRSDSRDKFLFVWFCWQTAKDPMVFDHTKYLKFIKRQHFVTALLLAVLVRFCWCWYLLGQEWSPVRHGWHSCCYGNSSFWTGRGKRDLYVGRHGEKKKVGALLNNSGRLHPGCLLCWSDTHTMAPKHCLKPQNTFSSTAQLAAPSILPAICVREGKFLGVLFQPISRTN